MSDKIKILNQFKSPASALNHSDWTSYIQEQEGYLYATDRHLIARTKGENEPAPILPKNIVLNKFFEKKDKKGTIKSKVLKEFLTKLKTEPVYQFNDLECANCYGHGSVECDLGHDHDCEQCDGVGKIPVKNKGDIINHTFPDNDDNENCCKVKIFDFKIKAEYLEKALIIGETIEIYSVKDNKAMMAVSGELELIIMQNIGNTNIYKFN